MELKSRDEILVSIAEEVKDYREGELPLPTPEHVDKWISQFDKKVQVPLLNAFSRNLVYISKSWFRDFLERQWVLNTHLTGSDGKGFWSKANILDIQQNGTSQHDIVRLLGEGLRTHFGLDIEQCGGSPDVYIYFDDILFSGSRIRQDLGQWVAEKAPRKCTLYILTAFSHTLGDYQTKKFLEDAAKKCRKDIHVITFDVPTLENKKANKNYSEVLWPAALPEHELVEAYLAEEHKFPFEPRKVVADNKCRVFYDEEDRQLLEKEFLLAGLRIRSFSENTKAIMRPLGFSPFGLGFGSMIVTYRNCPNNCPLALWWGDPREHSSGPLSKWYSLFPRRTYVDNYDQFGVV